MTQRHHCSSSSRTAWFTTIVSPIVVTMALIIGLLAIPLANGQAQSPKLDIILPSRDSLAMQHPAIRARGMATAKHTAELIRNGFPARLHFKLELWTATQFANKVRAQYEWETIVEFDALEETYRVIRALPERATLIGTYKTIDSADAKVAEPYRPAIALPRPGEKSYYTLTLTVEAMSLTDLDEVRRWLRGELRPAMRGKRNPGTAVTSGVRRLFVRMLGGERIQYDANTGTFTPPRTK